MNIDDEVDKKYEMPEIINMSMDFQKDKIE